MERIPTPWEYVQNYKLREEIAELKKENKQLINSNIKMYAELHDLKHGERINPKNFLKLQESNEKKDVTILNLQARIKELQELLNVHGSKYLLYLNEEERAQLKKIARNATSRENQRKVRKKNHEKN